MNQEKLTKEIIVTEAIELLNEEGLDGVSLRKIADRVGVKAPSLYWHFKDKDALLAAVVETIFDRCLDAVPARRDWRDWMRDFGVSVWRTQDALRDFGRLVTTTRLQTEQLQRTTARLRSKVRGLNLAESDAMAVQSAVQALMTGWSAFAHAPYAANLAQTLDFEALALSDLEALIAGKALQLTARSTKRRKRVR